MEPRMPLRVVAGTPAPEAVLPIDTATVAMDEVVPEVNMSTVGGATVATSASNASLNGPTSLSSPVTGAPSSPPQVAVNDNTVKEPEVILGHRIVVVSRDVSLSDAMGMTHFALNQVHDVLRQERADLDEERLHLLMWFSLLKKLMASKKAKVEARRMYVDVMEMLLDRQHATINELDAQAQ
jgi:hypothetical protein